MKKRSRKDNSISIDEATKAIRSVAHRTALLHICYARAILDELGEERGVKLISKAIKKYGVRIGQKAKEEVTRKGLEPTPENFNQNDSYAFFDFPGLHDRRETTEVAGVKKRRSYGCTFAKLWKEYGEEKLGRLYCYMDPAKYMAYNPDFKLVHTRTVPEGHEFCELELRRTTDEERRDFCSEDNDWFYIDQ